jgi:hypothetical protein
MITIQEAVKQLKPGDIVLYRSYKVIRDFTHSDVGHATVYIGLGKVDSEYNFVFDPNGEPFVVTADLAHGVNFYLLDCLDEIVRIKRPVQSFELGSALAWFVPFVGTPYGWADTIRDAISIGSDDPDSMNCSHTSAAFLAAGGCPQFDPLRDAHYITPRDLDYGGLATTIWSNPRRLVLH